MVSQICTITMYIDKILWPELSEKFSFPYYVVNNDSNFWTWSYFGSKQNKSIKKTHKQVSFLISIFELKQTSTFVLTENCWIWNFSATHLLDIFIACLRKVLKLRNIEVWRRLRQGMDKKMFLRTILGKIFGKQCRKSKKKPENLDICFWIIFLTATAKKNHFWRGGWALGSVPYQFWELPNIL